MGFLIVEATPLRFAILLLGALILNTPAQSASHEPIPAASYEILETYCLDCHDDIEMKAEISLESPEIEWGSPDSLELWERVIDVLRKGEMPPKKKRKPSINERASMVDWLDQSLSLHAPIGGTALRRLNRREYEHSLNALLSASYSLPDGFPEDNVANGFDNQGAALALSGPLLKSYSQVATELAEKLFPPVRKPVEPTTFEIMADDFTYAYSSGLLVNGAMRLAASSNQIAHSGSWPSRFEAPTSGVYDIQLDLSTFNPPDGESVVCSVYAVDAVTAPQKDSKELRQLGEFHLNRSSVEQFELKAILEKGETIVLRYSNASLKEDRAQLSRHLKKILTDDPLLAAAYKKADGKVARAGLGWETLKDLMKSDLLPDPPKEEVLDELIEVIVKSLRSTTETLAYKHFEEGPALEIRRATIHGPTALVDSREDKYWKKRTSKLIGPRDGRSDERVAREFLDSFLPTAFRRPVPAEVMEDYWGLFRDEFDASDRLEDGLHIALRTSLTSPYFLYRGFESGRLDSYDLASRLSYFLTSRPPDSELAAAARNGSLTQPEVLRAETERLLAKAESSDFVGTFLDQWLDLAALEDLTPDKTLFPKPKEFKYTNVERESLISEANLFFREMLDTNRPMEDFIDPDFTYTNTSVGRNIYELPMTGRSGKEPKGEMVRVSLERGGRFGGVLGMAGVMMATANGVDTQPVLRGVWVLENVLGDPPPPPPDAVPALTPDTSKAETPRDLLATHTVEDSCAGCHKKIDPIGFALESFDPIGRWRTHYPALRSAGKKKNEKQTRLPVDTAGVMPDGTKLSGIQDLKAYLVRDITPFSECLAEKLLTFATGRRMNYSDRKLIRELVRENRVNGEGFKDLLLAIVDSESFRTK